MRLAWGGPGSAGHPGKREVHEVGPTRPDPAFAALSAARETWRGVARRRRRAPQAVGRAAGAEQGSLQIAFIKDQLGVRESAGRQRAAAKGPAGPAGPVGPAG